MVKADDGSTLDVIKTWSDKIVTLDELKYTCASEYPRIFKDIVDALRPGRQPLERVSKWKGDEKGGAKLTR